MDNEIWKDIEELNGDYQISNLGRLKRTKNIEINLQNGKAIKFLNGKKIKMVT